MSQNGRSQKFLAKLGYDGSWSRQWVGETAFWGSHHASSPLLSPILVFPFLPDRNKRRTTSLIFTSDLPPPTKPWSHNLFTWGFLAPKPEQNFYMILFLPLCAYLSLQTSSSHWKAITGTLGRIFYEYHPLFSSLHIYPPASPPSPSPSPPPPSPPFPPPSSFLLSAYLSSTGSTLPLPANNTVWIEEKETEIKYVFFQISRDGCFQFVLTCLAFTQSKVWTGRKYLHSGLRLVHRWKYFKVFICWKYL